MTTRRIYQQLRDEEDLKYTELLNDYIAKQDKEQAEGPLKLQSSK